MYRWRRYKNRHDIPSKIGRRLLNVIQIIKTYYDIIMISVVLFGVRQENYNAVLPRRKYFPAYFPTRRSGQPPREDTFATRAKCGDNHNNNNLNNNNNKPVDSDVG